MKSSEVNIVVLPKHSIFAQLNLKNLEIIFNRLGSRGRGHLKPWERMEVIPLIPQCSSHISLN